MISKGINLLVDKRNVQTKVAGNGRLKYMRLGAIGILFGAGAFTIILSILIVLSPLPQLRVDEQKSRDALDKYKLDINKLSFINDRGDSIRKILKQRPLYDKRIEVIQNKVPQGVSFDGFTINKKSYTFRFSSTNLELINELLDSITAISGKGREYSRVYLTSLSTDEESHRFVVVVDLLTV